MAGKTEMARFAADRAAELANDAAADDARAELYAAAALIVTDEFDDALKKLEAIDMSKLTAEDSQLLQSALSVATRLREWPEPVVIPEALREDRAARAPELEAETQSIAELTKRVREAIARTDEFLKRQTQ